MPNVDVAVPAKALLGECPLWSERESALYWLDIDGRVIHRFDTATGRDEERHLEGRPGSLAVTDTPGWFLVAVEHQLVWFDWADGSVTPWIDLEQPRAGVRLNDGRCDRRGRFWVGSLYLPTSAGKTVGMLHRVDGHGVTETVRRNIGVSNGLAFSPEGDVMYFADTPQRTVWAYDYDADTGTPTNERVLTDFGELPGKPDGACVDVDGCYWIACVYGWAVARLTPSGVVDRIVDLPVEKPTMPAFGGPGLDTLFVTSIGVRSGDTPGSAQPNSGDLLALDVGVSGLADVPFARASGTFQSTEV